uniref:Uncharacterized protein n=1 Tax=Meloidogyne enterolobii TaxID=390850 RepID=A0A6V7WRP9_MELEN|nr:unnamed protein product [Meloidogyne enterolobii]
MKVIKWKIGEIGQKWLRKRKATNTLKQGLQKMALQDKMKREERKNWKKELKAIGEKVLKVIMKF